MTFFDAFDKVKAAWPDRPYDWAFHLAVIEEAGLPCDHPLTLREFSGGLNVLRWYNNQSSHMQAQLNRNGLGKDAQTYCPVCMTRNPKEPVDTRQQRVDMLKGLLATAFEQRIKIPPAL